MSKMKEIQERWEKVTAGPWELVPMPRHPGTWDIWGVRHDEVIGDGESHVAEVRGYERDAEAIAWAPEDVATLLGVLEGVRAAATNPDYGWVDAGIEIERILNDFDSAWLHGKAADD